MISEVAPNARILIVLLGSIGDVVRGLAVASALKKALPQSHISWVVEPKSYEIVKLNAAIDKIFLFQRHLGLKGFVQVIREIQSQSFDITLDLQRHLKSGVLSYLSKSARRIGFHRRDAKEFNWLFNTEQIPFLGSSTSKLDHYLSFLTHAEVS